MRLAMVVLCGFFSLLVMAQNMTDLAVMSDQSADSRIMQSDFPVVDDSVFRHPDRIRFDSRCISINGKDEFIMSGSVHYYRIPRELWQNRLLKIKEAGFNCVETYVPWNWHEKKEPKSVSDYSKLDLSELDEFLTMCHDLGFYTIVRPGPYICSEWSGGGFPQWLMNKRPTHTKHEVWLQSDDEEFMRWNKHWYDAVCRVVAPHQISNRRPGEGGMIFFQIENEFNRVKWIPSESKKDYLESLARIVRDNGIDVPVITCWTNEARNVGSGPLNGVIDMVNSYPRWEIEKNFGRLINQQLKTQPGKPLISGELQGGWYGAVGGKLPWNQDGIAGVQTQNITLYALQRGFCALNYYMLAGGTNFDDMAARGVTTSYDFAAAIGENGIVNERYYRLSKLAPFLKEHGPAIARAKEIYPADATVDSLVQVCLRITPQGDRYYFVRTEDHFKGHSGTVSTDGVTFDYVLEPFGSMVYYIPAGEKAGKWFPQVIEPASRPYVAKHEVNVVKYGEFPDALPNKWTKLKKGETIDRKGINGRHFIYYRCKAKEGGMLEISRPGKGVVNGTDADTALVMVGKKIMFPVKETRETAFYRLPGDSTTGRLLDIVMLYESKGLHHHTNNSVEHSWHIGPSCVRNNGNILPLEYAYTEAAKGIEFSLPGKISNINGNDENGLLRWNLYEFSLPEMPEGLSYPYQLNLKHTGNGFIYLNGHALGRCWQGGPQRDYYLPDCWLNHGGENHISISLRPTPEGAHIEELKIIPLVEGAEK